MSRSRRQRPLASSTAPRLSPLRSSGGNLIVTPPMNVTVLETERAELECLPKDPQSAVEWYRQGALLNQLPELAARSEVAANGSLVVRVTTSSDPGEYECRVSSPDGHIQSASAFLDVHCEYSNIFRTHFCIVFISNSSFV